MAGDWIKMRAALMSSPKLIAMARALHADRCFREWLVPGSGDDALQRVTDDALRCVTCALLLRVWSSSREFGKFTDDDLILSHITLSDLDLMAGAPGVGEAMKGVGWAIESDGVVLPNFKQHNVPMTNADRQKEYRDRVSSRNETVTNGRNESVTKSVTRVEKRREDKNKEEGYRGTAKKSFVKPTLQEVTDYCRERGNGVPPEIFLAHYESVGWKVGKNQMKDWKAAIRATWEPKHPPAESKVPDDEDLKNWNAVDGGLKPCPSR